jgi:hypothetical protein
MNLVDRALALLGATQDPAAWHPDDPRTVLLKLDDELLLRITESLDGQTLELAVAPGWVDWSGRAPEERTLQAEQADPHRPEVQDGLCVLEDGLVVLTRRWPRAALDAALLREEVMHCRALHRGWRPMLRDRPPAD